MKNIRSKKSQMEIMGLAIVVILLVMAMLFVIKFVLLKKPATYKQEFTSTQLASNTVHTLLKTTAAGCRGLSFSDLFQDCAEGGLLECDNEEPSCDYIKTETGKILSSTLDTWGIAYELSAFLENQDPFIRLGQPCPAGKKTKPFPIPGVVTFYIKLDICE